MVSINQAILNHCHRLRAAIEDNFEEEPVKGGNQLEEDPYLEHIHSAEEGIKELETHILNCKLNRDREWILFYLHNVDQSLRKINENIKKGRQVDRLSYQCGFQTAPSNLQSRSEKAGPGQSQSQRSSNSAASSGGREYQREDFSYGIQGGMNYSTGSKGNGYPYGSQFPRGNVNHMPQYTPPAGYPVYTYAQQGSSVYGMATENYSARGTGFQQPTWSSEQHPDYAAPAGVYYNHGHDHYPRSERHKEYAAEGILPEDRIVELDDDEPDKKSVSKRRLMLPASTTGKNSNEKGPQSTRNGGRQGRRQ
ncbi:hypothetical protein EV356DRAFT_569307 [Viridothelium virens]|uniref:Uncharacterized protein n=1 Tax=Viridothelium virens TaxID=1048519 RepID=A0A6A6H1Z5_VIRVR|nr:hypothetical protein EV356DRAFT_569307 [Viridothelium virens]